MVHDRVIEFLRVNGPSQPVEISTKVGYDSFVMKAVLLELINKGLVKKSNRTIGSSLVYYLPEQVNRMRKMLYADLGIPDKKVLDTLAKKGEVMASELSPHERAFINRLLDFITVKQVGDDYQITHFSYNGKPKEEIVKELKPPEIKPLERELRLFDHSSEVKKKTSAEGFNDKVKEYLKGVGEVISSKKIKNNREYDYHLKIAKPFPQELFVKAKRKKSINESDLSVVYTEALKLKKPALIVTNGNLTKKAQKWKKENVGDLVKVVQIK